MPRQPARSAVEIFNVLKDLPIFDVNRNLKKEKHEVDGTGVNVWNEASRLLCPMNAHLIYITILNNRENLKNELKCHHFPTSTLKPVQPEQQRSNTPVECNHSEEIAVSGFNETSVEEKYSIPDEYESLIRMKYDVRYNSTIQKLCLRPFSITLISPEHRDTYKLLVNADVSIGITIIDAFAPRIRIKHYESKTNHLISTVSKVENHLIILCQRICEKRSCSNIKYLLLDFFKDEVMDLPLQFHVPFHEGILTNISLALNTCTFNEYNKQCLEYIQNRRGSLPSVLLNIDLMNILMRVDQVKYFNDLLPVVQMFYIKCIIVLRLTKTLEDFESFVSSMFTCLLSPYDNQDIDTQKKILDDKINKNEVLQIYRSFLEYKENKCFNNINMVNDKIGTVQVLKYIQDLKAKVRLYSNPGLPNVYYCPEWYYGQLIYLLSSFTSWTGLLLNGSDVDFVFKAITNQKELRTNENSFANFLSNTIMQSKETMRNGRSVLNNRKKSSNQQSKKKKSNQKQIFQKSEENWGGKNDCYKPAKQFIREVIANESAITDGEATTSLVTNELVDIKVHNMPHEKFIIKKPAENSQDGFLENTLLEVSKDVEQRCTPDFIENVDLSLESFDIVVTEDLNEEIHSSKIKKNERRGETNSALFLKQSNELFTSNSGGSNDCFVPVTNSSLECHELSYNSSNNSLLDHNYYSKTQDEISTLNRQSVCSTNRSLEILTADFEESSDAVNVYEMPSENSTYKIEQRQNIELGEKKTVDVKIKAIEMEQSAYVNKFNEEFVLVRTEGSKYLVAAPSMELTHAQASVHKGKESIIRNATKLIGRNINSLKCTFEDTSKFDVFAEIFSFAYKYYNTFQNVCLCDKTCVKSCNTDCFMQTVQKYCRTGSSTTMYYGRANLLYRYANVNDNTCVIKIDETLSDFFKKMMGDHNSFTMNITCSFCNRLTNVLHGTVLTLEIFPSVNLSDLQILLDSYFERTFRSAENLCKECATDCFDSIRVHYYWESYLCIDLKESNIHEFINAAPQFINVPNNKGEEKARYALVGVVTPDSQSNLHMYVAYCQTLQQHWDRRSGIIDKIKKVRKLKRTRIILLVYIKISNI